MRSLPVMLSLAFALTSLTACDKSQSADKSDAKADAKTDDKADAKKTGEGEVAANTTPEADPEAGCIHEDKPKNHDEGEGCDHHGAAPTESTGHFGAEFALADAVPLSSVLAAELPADAVKVSGTVESVCQMKGCWMVIKDGDVQARVLVKDHAFAIPMDGKGKAALVEGTLEAKDLTEANVAHLKKDGDDTLVGDGARQEVFLHATAVELQAS
jgi:hypothetical protein